MEKYSVSIKRSAVKELQQIPPKFLRQITRRIQSLADNPRPEGSQKLTSQEQYRIRQGEYRILYSVDDKRRIVDVVKIAHRREVYR